MVVTESLAKGLRTNFLQLLERECLALDRRLDDLVWQRFDAKNTKQVNRYLKQLSEAAALPPVMHQGVYGSKHRSCWWALLLQPDRSRPVTDEWTEACLRIDIHRVYLSPHDWRFTFLPVLLGEHCIARLFQRLPWKADPYAAGILPELRELTANISWATILDALMTKLHPGIALSLFIPTTHGVFLGCHHPTDNGLFEIRTFVGKEQLTPRQLAFWQVLMDARAKTPMASFVGHLLQETAAPEAQAEAVETCGDSIMAIMQEFVNYQDVLSVEVVQERLPTVEEVGYLPKDQRGKANPEGLPTSTWSLNVSKPN